MNVLRIIISVALICLGALTVGMLIGEFIVAYYPSYKQACTNQ